MAVPTSGNFEMFGTGSNTTIAGAIVEGGGNVDGLDTFTLLRAASNPDLFDETYSGVVTNAINHVSASQQYRNYPQRYYYMFVRECTDGARVTDGVLGDLVVKSLTDITSWSHMLIPRFPGDTAAYFEVYGTATRAEYDTDAGDYPSINLDTIAGVLQKSDCNYTPTPTPTTTVTPTPTITVTPTPTLVTYYYQLAHCNDGPSNSIYVFSIGMMLPEGSAYSYFGNCYEYYDVDPGQTGTIDLAGLSTCVCVTPTPTPTPTDLAPTPTPTSTPTPTITPTPTPLGCFTYSIANNDFSQNLSYRYRDCDGNLISDQVVLADSSTPDFCAEEGSVSRQSGTFSWVLTTEATTCTVVPPTPTPTPTITVTPQITPTPVTPTPTPTVTSECNCITVAIDNDLLQSGGEDLYYIVNDCAFEPRDVNLGSSIGEENNGSMYFGICSSGTTSDLFKYGTSGSPFVGLPGMNIYPNSSTCTRDLDCLPEIPVQSTPTPTQTPLGPTPTPTVTLNCDNNIVAGNNNPLSDRGYMRDGFNIGTIDTNVYPLETPLSGWIISRFTYSNTYDSNTLWLSAQGEDRPYPNLFDNLKVTTPQGIANFTPQNSNPSLSGKNNNDGRTVVFYTWDNPDVKINNGDAVCLEWSGPAPVTPTPTPTDPAPTPTPTSTPVTPTPTSTPVTPTPTSTPVTPTPTSTPVTPTPTSTPVTPTPTPTPLECDSYYNNSGQVLDVVYYDCDGNFVGESVGLGEDICASQPPTGGGGGYLVYNGPCGSALPTPTPTPTSTPITPTPTSTPITPTPTSTPVTPTPTPTIPAGCNRYYIVNSTGVGVTVTFTSTNCNTGQPETWYVGPDGYELICSSTEPVATTNGGYGEVTYEGPCSITPTPTPTSTPVTPTPTFTPAPSCPTETLGYSTETSTDACNNFHLGGTVRYLDGPFPFASVIYRNTDCTGKAPLGYYSDGGVWRYWNGTSFSTNGSCGDYGFV